MRDELDKQLCEKYPKIFADRYKPMTETAMCWGIECGDGWYNIIDQLCGNIQSHIDWKEKQGGFISQVVAEQVKEKFGTLRFYFDTELTGLVKDIMYDCVRAGEFASTYTCEYCGNSLGKLQTETGWVKTSCSECWAKKMEERKNRDEALTALVRFNEENGLMINHIK